MSQHSSRSLSADPPDLGRITGRIESYCRRRVPDCRVVAVVAEDGAAIDLRIGPADGPDTDHVRVRDLDPASLGRDEDVDRLARLLRVWIEPEARPPVAARRPRLGALSAPR